MRHDELSEAIGDYLKQIWKLQAGGELATTSALARRLQVAPSSASAMVKKLAALGLAEHQPYRGARLTPAGERAAIELVRRHRLIERYLAQALGLSIDSVHAEADRLEHALSERLETRIDESLGFPTHDPHGDPIPDGELKLASTRGRSLVELAPGERATIRRVPDGDASLLRYLSSLALLPDRPVEVCRAAPFGGPLAVLADGVEQTISRELAARIDVS